MAARLRAHYDVLFAGPTAASRTSSSSTAARSKRSGVRVEDIAKRLMDYGFHAPTMSFPVPGTLMIEPTESEPRAELDRLCDALIAIRAEIRAIESGELDAEDNPLCNAPHTARAVSADAWPHRYSREQAAWPGAVAARAQVLAAGRRDRQRVRRPQPGLHLPADRGPRGVGDWSPGIDPPQCG
jgi:glycine dehydrogenase